jgi:hypothetical protein
MAKNTIVLHSVYGFVIACLIATLLYGYRLYQLLLVKADAAAQRYSAQAPQQEESAVSLRNAYDSIFALYRTTDDSLGRLRRERRELLMRLRDNLERLHALRYAWSDSVSTYYDRERQYLERMAALEQQIIQSTPQAPLVSLRFLSAKDNEKIIYIGHAVDSMASGYGIGMWESGSVYEGEWHQNKRHGKGVHQWKDGIRYEGEFVEDYRTGMGTYYWKNGDKYVGQWKNGKRNGAGTVYDKHGAMKVVGRWVDDKLVERLPMQPLQSQTP